MGWEDFGTGSDRVDHRRPYLGRGLLAGGLGAALLAIALVGAGGIAGALGLGTLGAREVAGALAGLGLAAALVGALAVVPTDRRAWHQALGGACLAVFGVGAFLWAYPGRWYGDSVDLSLSVLAVYALGVLVVLAHLLATVSGPGRRGRHAGALGAILPTVGGPAPAADGTGIDRGAEGAEDTEGTGEGGAGGTAGTDRSEGEVLYERTSEPGSSNSSAAEAATGSERPTIDRIESTDGGFAWGESGEYGGRLGAIERTEPDGRTTASTGRSAADDRTERATRWPETNRGHSTVAGKERSQVPDRNGRGGHARKRTPVAIASDGAGGSETPAAALGANEANEAIDSSEPGEVTAIDADSGSDPGVRTDERSRPADGGVDTLQFGPSVDRYCGNCGYFQYVRTEAGIVPYCGYHEELMEDMEPCLGWTQNA